MREGHKDVPEPVLVQAFAIDVSRLPAYAGQETPQGAYALLRVTRVQDGVNLTPEKAREVTERLRLAQGQQVMSAYITGLRQKAGVKINKELLENRDERGAPPPAPAKSDRPAPPRRGVF
jgi:peptidyl-prolyl cis-trans isomerase D